MLSPFSFLLRWPFLRQKLGALHNLMQECSHEVHLLNMRSSFHLPESVRIGHGTQIYGSGRVAIGADTYMGEDCFISSHPDSASIVIGKCCAIAHNVHIRTAEFPRTEHFRDAFKAASYAADIKIGDYVWIGNHVYIGPGITIGDNVIIGANSVVTKDIPADSIAAGVPARIIRHKSYYAHRPPEHGAEGGAGQSA